MAAATRASAGLSSSRSDVFCWARSSIRAMVVRKLAGRWGDAVVEAIGDELMPLAVDADDRTQDIDDILRRNTGALGVHDSESCEFRYLLWYVSQG